MSRRAPLLEQEQRDVARPMCAAAPRPVSQSPAAPVPGGVDESGLLGEERADDVEVAVRVGDEGLNRSAGSS